MQDAQGTALAVGDVVQHIFWGRYATVTSIGRKYITVDVHLAGRTAKWQPTSVRLVKAGTAQ
jgi:hypothetical protein